MRKICFVTGTRADYGIMAPLMKLVKESEDTELQIVATNMHLSEAHGMTVKEIENDGFTVNYKVASCIEGDSASSTVKSMGMTAIGIADAFEGLKPDLVVILGDRYEALAAASSALLFNIPVAHLHGGETTEGAYDDAMRHAITKIATYHFPATRKYAENIIGMREKPENVFFSGALGVENALKEKIISLEELEKDIDFKLGDKYCVVTFHPATREPGSEEVQTKELLAALQEFIGRGWKFLVTMPNSDTGGRKVAGLMEEWAKGFPDSVKTVKSLGRKRFFSALSYASAIIGNSSSGIIEAPVFRIPTIDIGDRQKGRIAGISVFHSSPFASDIIATLEEATSEKVREKLESATLEDLDPYYKPEAAENILCKLKEVRIEP